MKKLTAILLASFLVANISAGAGKTSKANFVEHINILFLKEDHATLIRSAEKNLRNYRLNTKEKKEVLYLTGLSYIKLKNFTRARGVFKKILAMKGDDFRQDAYMGIADSHFDEKNFNGAINAYKKVLRIYPRGDRLSSVYYNLGLIYKAKKDPHEANYYFRKVKKEFGRSFEADKSSYVPVTRRPAYYIIQLGAFRSLKNAKKLVGRLRRKKYDSYIQKTRKDGRTLYKVRGGKFSNKSYALRLLRRLRKSGFLAKVIVE
jgi:tetratricopeptide (TPR) repeat protein